MSYLKGLTVIITGGGGGLGSSYGVLFAQHGANVVINDFSAAAAERVVKRISAAGGRAVADTHNATDGEAIVATAIAAFGRVDVVICNAGQLIDKAFRNMTLKDYTDVLDTHLTGAFAVTKAAWPYFVKQKFGRVVLTSSAAGIFGSFGQANYCSAKAALIAFGKSVAKEGEPYNIAANVLGPLAASAMLATVMTPEVLANLPADAISPLIVALISPTSPERKLLVANKLVTGRLWEAGGFWMGETRWNRTKGACITASPDAPAELTKEWAKASDISGIQFATGPAFPIATIVFPSKSTTVFKGMVVIITGATSAWGKVAAGTYALGGANLVLVDTDASQLDALAGSATKAGGVVEKMVSEPDQATSIVQRAIDRWGSIHIIIPAARYAPSSAKSIGAIDSTEWAEALRVNVVSAQLLALACWPIFQKQKFGRIILTTTVEAIFGSASNLHVASSAGAAIGLMRCLKVEGAKYNILANAIATSVDPTKAGADQLLTWLGHRDSTVTGQVIEVQSGVTHVVRWQRAYGKYFDYPKPTTVKDVYGAWKDITSYDRHSFPVQGPTVLEHMMVASRLKYKL